LGSQQATIYIGLILATVPFILQLVASVFSYLGRDGATGAAIGVLSTTWLALGLIHIVSESLRRQFVSRPAAALHRRRPRAVVARRR
jgi:hypothetical protein